MIDVNAKYCPQNHPCPMVGRCPGNALRQQEYHAPVLLSELCMDCGDCASFCRVFTQS